MDSFPQSAHNDQNIVPMSISMPPPAAWKYRIEGFQKMVFTNADPSTTPPTVLCLYKNSLAPPSPTVQRLFATYLYPYLLPIKLVHLPADYCDHLLQSATGHRPAHRDPKYTALPVASLHPDVARRFGPDTIMVEFKPKSAALSRSRLSPPRLGHGLQKFSVPVYHIKHYRVNGLNPSSPYNPSDLLSGDEIRMRRAVDALIEENSNGLQVFLSGQMAPLVVNEVAKSAEAQQAIEVALSALRKDKQAIEAIKIIQRADVLDATGADVAIHTLQERLGKDHAWSAVQQAMKSRCEEDQGFSTDSMRAVGTFPDIESASDEEMQPFLEKITYRSPQEGATLHDENKFRAASRALRAMPDEVLVRLIADFMQAATAKDCSILVAFAQSRIEEADIEVDAQGWMYEVSVIDVGEKGLDKLSKWKRVDLTQLESIDCLESSNC